MRGVDDLLQSLRLLLPDWAFWPLLVLGMSLLVPAWIRGRQVKSLRQGVQRRVRMNGARREEQAERLLNRAGSDVRKLEALAEEAQRLEQEDLLRSSLERLDAHPKGPPIAERLRGKRAREHKPPAHPLQETLAIRRLIDEQLYDLARERLAQGQHRFPEDPALASLAEELQSLSPPSSAG